MTHSFPSRRSSDLLGGGAAGTGRGEDAVEGLLDAGADRRPRRRPLLARGRPDDRSATVHRRRLDSAVAAGAVATAVPPTPFVTLGLDPRVQGKRRSGRPGCSARWPSMTIERWRGWSAPPPKRPAVGRALKAFCDAAPVTPTAHSRRAPPP